MHPRPTSGLGQRARESGGELHDARGQRERRVVEESARRDGREANSPSQEGRQVASAHACPARRRAQEPLIEKPGRWDGGERDQ
jgi:hypothetical protein